MAYDYNTGTSLWSLADIYFSGRDTEKWQRDARNLVPLFFIESERLSMLPSRCHRGSLMSWDLAGRHQRRFGAEITFHERSCRCHWDTQFSENRTRVTSTVVRVRLLFFKSRELIKHRHDLGCQYVLRKEFEPDEWLTLSAYANHSMLSTNIRSADSSLIIHHCEYSSVMNTHSDG